MANQIIEESLKQNQIHKSKHKLKKIHIQFSNEIAEIPYGGNFTITHHSQMQYLKTFVKKKKYQLQFILSSSIAVIFLLFLLGKIYQYRQKEKVSRKLLDNYQLTTLYSDNSHYEASPLNSDILIRNPFVIGMIKIDKIALNYPILSESNDELLRISLCRFNGPMPNEVGNLCIAGHNYIDNRFFGRLNELSIGDTIEIYGLSGQKKDYEIYKKFEVDANDLSCTNQNIGKQKMITLLTCDNSNQNRRIVIQGKELK
ncbi:MAG: sortase [Clostridia bacterium]|nr:sortase [Clostridia bacterium]